MVLYTVRFHISAAVGKALKFAAWKRVPAPTHWPMHKRDPTLRMGITAWRLRASVPLMCQRLTAGEQAGCLGLLLCLFAKDGSSEYEWLPLSDAGFYG